MTKIFIDANILVAVLNKEYPLFRTAARVLSLSEHKPFQLYTSATCLAIAFYFSEKKNGTKAALEKIKLLSAHLSIANAGQEEVQAALSNKKIKDFEDGIQHYAAKHAGCKYIVTEDVHDYFFSDLEVLNTENFLQDVAINMVTKNL